MEKRWILLPGAWNSINRQSGICENPSDSQSLLGDGVLQLLYPYTPSGQATAQIGSYSDISEKVFNPRHFFMF